MALATKCPHCNTVFRVAHDQLKLRGGIVRCGACDQVFDGNAALVEPPLPMSAPPPAAPSPPSPAPFDARMAALDTRAAEALQAPEEAPLALQLDQDDTYHEIETLPQPEPDAAPQQWPEQVAPILPEAAPEFRPEPAATALPEAAQAPAAEPEWPLALDLDLDLGAEHDDGPALQIEDEVAEPAVASNVAPALPPASAPLLEQELAMDTPSPSDTELADTLATELATLAETVGHTLEPLSDAALFTDDSRREPSFGPAPHDTGAAAVDNANDDENDNENENESDDADLAALVQLSGAGQDAAAHAAPAAQSQATAPAEDHAALAPHAHYADAYPEDEPGFVKRARRHQRYGKASTIAMSAGSVLLLAALAGQGVTTFRNQLAASTPQMKAAMVAACAALGCTIELPTQIDELSIEQGELQTLSETAFSFTTLLRNQSGTVQAWPHIELKLDDANDKTILRRVFAPGDYLGPDATPEQGFAPHSEQSVKLYFELAQLKASGYHIAVFYP